MKQKAFFSILVSVTLLICGFGPTTDQKLSVQITGLDNSNMTVWVSVFSKEAFLEKPLQRKSIQVKGNKAFLEFNLPAGEYAISTYQDTNGNNKLDRYFYGKPKEPYGFSNNISPKFGPPKYEDCKFLLGKQSKSISIELLN